MLLETLTRSTPVVRAPATMSTRQTWTARIASGVAATFAVWMFIVVAQPFISIQLAKSDLTGSPDLNGKLAVALLAVAGVAWMLSVSARVRARDNF